MKRFFILCLIAAALFAVAALAGCSKKCEGCTITIKTYIDGELQAESTSSTDCDRATPGTTVKRADLAYGKTLTTIQTTKCY